MSSSAASSFSSSCAESWSGASLFIAADVSGNVHCYRYCSSPTPSLHHLWTRRLDNNDDGESKETVTGDSSSRRGSNGLDTSQFQCILSKRFNRLGASLPRNCNNDDVNTGTPTAAEKTKRPQIDANSAKFASVDTTVFEDASSSTSNTQGAPQCLSAAVDGANLEAVVPSASAAHAGRKDMLGRMQPPPNKTEEKSISSKTASPMRLPADVCPFCASPSLNSPISPNVSVSATTKSLSSTHLSPTSSREAAGDAHRQAADRGLPFACADFMARVPDLSLSSASSLASSSAVPLARNPVRSPAAADGAESIQASAASPTLFSGVVSWYWRCPSQCISAASMNDTQNSDGGDQNMLADSPPTWLALPEAVRQWNAHCCQRHRLLLLRKMEETFHEVDLLTGEPLRGTDVASDFFATAALAPVGDTSDSDAASSPSMSSSDSRSTSSSSLSGDADSSEEVSAPRAVLSLTVQRHQALVVQMPAQPAAKSGKSKPTKRQRSSPTPSKRATTCLVKLAAPTVQFGVTWYPPERQTKADLTMSSDVASSMDDVEEEGECGSTACPSTAPPRPPSQRNVDESSRSSSSSSHHHSTSASDIDMDILSGRKPPPPPQYHFVRNVSSASTSSLSTAASSSSASSALRRKVTTSSKQHTQDGEEHAVEICGIPIRCGRSGEVFAVGQLRGGEHESGKDSNSVDADEADGDASAVPQPLLQCATAIVHAVWVTLPSREEEVGALSPEEALVGLRNRPLTLCVRVVPWVTEHACTVKVMEASAQSIPSLLHAHSNAARPTPDSAPSASATTPVITPLCGYLLQTSASPLRLSQVSFPQVLRPLAALDVLHAAERNAFSASPHRSLLTFASNLVGGEYVGEELHPTNAHDDSSQHRQLRYPARPPCDYPKAHVRRENPHGSSVSSLMDDGSVTQRIAPLPPHFIPATSFFDENFEPLTILGKGVGGAVLLARHRVTGVFYAVKVLVARDYESERDILQEVRVHAMLENKYVVRYHACWSEVISATRAQQLAFIGVCHPNEANLPRRQRLAAAAAAASASTRRSDGPTYGVAGDRSSSLSRPPRAPGQSWRSPTRSEEDLTHRGGGGGGTAGQLRRAPGGWDRLMLPSHSSMLLIGSESASETVSPTTTVTRTSAKLRRNNWSTAIVDEYAAEDEDEEEEEESDKSDSRGDDQDYVVTQNGKHASFESHRAQQRAPAAAAPAGRKGTSILHRAFRKAKKLQQDDSSDGSGSATCDSSSSTSSDGDRGEEHTVIGSRVVFLQMEFCQVTLAHYLASRAGISRVENLVILLQIVSGLRYLHSRGVLHRDLKPTNVFMDFRCQYDKIVHSPNSTSSSSSSGSSNTSASGSEGDGSSISEDDDGHAGHKNNGNHYGVFGGGRGRGNARATPPSSSATHPRRPTSASRSSPSDLPRSVSWGEDSDGGQLNSCTALSLRPRGSFPMSPRGRSRLNGSGGSHAALPGYRPSMDPVTALELNTGNATFDNSPVWDVERSALDVVLHSTHQDASCLLHTRLRKRPPPRFTATPESPLRASGAAPASSALLRFDNGRRFLQHLAKWLCHHFVQVRLGDFGLAKFLYQQDMRVDGFVSLNAANTIGVGSPLYASPEQLKGNRCTPASDAFAVGVIMAEMYLQPTTIAERLTVLREVRDGVYEDAAMLARYPELKLVQRLTLAQPERRATLAAAQTALKLMLLKALQEEVHLY